MSRILITGGAGFIASHLAAKLAASGEHHVVIADNLQTGKKSHLPINANGNIEFIKSDVNRFEDISGLFYSYRFDYVFHYAATVGVKRTLANPTMVLEDIEGIKNILNLSKNTGVKRVYYSSSSEVYGEPVEIPQNEKTTPLNSKLPYAIVKNIGEAFLRSYNVEFGLEYTIFRFFNTYGPNQSEDFVMSKFVRAALNGDDLTIYGDGLQTRTFCYINDNTDACTKIFQQGKIINDVINIGSNVETSILGLANTIVDILGSKSRIVHLPPLKEGDMTRRMPDNSRMLEVLGRELVPLHEGIERMLKSDQFAVA